MSVQSLLDIGTNNTEDLVWTAHDLCRLETEAAALGDWAKQIAVKASKLAEVCKRLEKKADKASLALLEMQGIREELFEFE